MSDLTFIITAGGIGKRMGKSVPKQFLEVHQVPILLLTLIRIHNVFPDAQFIITLPKVGYELWKRILINHSCTIAHELVEGGKERYHSIQNALNIAHGDYIAIHDGVRPFVSKQVLLELVEKVKTKKALVPIVDLKESIRQVDGKYSNSVDRSQYKIVQTPQIFSRELIVNAYQNEWDDSLTDDASLVEKAGYSIHFISGNEENLKITSPLDLLLAEQLYKEMILENL